MFFEVTARGVVIRVRLQPNASGRRVAGIYEGADGKKYLKVCVVSIPEKGRANQELVEWLAKKLKLAKSCLRIVAGMTERDKKILIDCEKEYVLPALEALAKGD